MNSINNFQLSKISPATGDTKYEDVEHFQLILHIRNCMLYVVKCKTRRKTSPGASN